MNVQHRFDGAEEAPVLLLSNGLGTTFELWDSNVDALIGRFRLLRYLHRGHGGSHIPTGPYLVDDHVDDVLELLDRLELERVTFCGLSLGGAVGMALARRAPERLDGLVLCCTAARFGEPEAWAERAHVVREYGLEALADAILERWFTPSFHATRPETVAAFRALLVATPREGYAACCDGLGQWDFRDQLDSINLPTLVIAAAQDPATPPQELELIAERIPNAQLVVISDCAHLANVEQPQMFARVLLEGCA